MGYIQKDLEKGYLEHPGLHAVLTTCLRFSSVLDGACVACCLCLSTGSYHVYIQIHSTGSSLKVHQVFGVGHVGLSPARRGGGGGFGLWVGGAGLSGVHDAAPKSMNLRSPYTPSYVLVKIVVCVTKGGASQGKPAPCVHCTRAA